MNLKPLVLAMAITSALSGCKDKDAETTAVTSPVPAASPAAEPAMDANAALAAAEAAVPENPLKEAYFGEQHMHTSYSLDAYIGGNRMTPDDALRFAQGEVMTVNGTPHRIGRPLDWAAITDHAEYIGEMYSTQVDDAPGHDNPQLVELRGLKTFDAQEDWFLKYVISNNRSGHAQHPPFFAGEGTIKSAWQLMIDTNNAHYHPGRFTTIPAFEWTAAPNGANMHRNVLFRDVNVLPDMPFSGIDSSDEEVLWTWIERQRIQGSVLFAIPHNSNASKGQMFEAVDNSGQPIDKAYAERRSGIERSIEIMQIKGNSEVTRSFWPADEFAGFENADSLANYSGRTIAKENYVRYAVIKGLGYQANLGANPYQLGFVGGTDNHNGTMSDVAEDDWIGGHGPADGTVDRRRTGDVGGWIMGKDENPGAITGVWAPKNTRGAIYDAMFNRETFATSGPRIKVRMFAGAGLTSNPTDAVALVKEGYSQGVPMGGTLNRLVKAPTITVYAEKDGPGANLDRIQIIKGWVDANGDNQERIIDVVWSGDRVRDSAGKLPPVGNTVNLETAAYTNDIGAAVLMGSWTDDDFDPEANALYYARVLEIPTPRWSTFDAVRNQLPLLENVPPTIQERAWTSPIWYVPVAAVTAKVESSSAEVAPLNAGAYLPDANRKFPERVLWGDQHVHTAWSFDAGIAGARLTPEDAVRFARGEPVHAENGDEATLHRALDWIAVTDHSDGMGVFSELESGNPEITTDPTAERWYQMMSESPEQALAAKKEVVAAQATLKLPKVLTDPKWMTSAWEKTVDIMEKYNEPGRFTAFIAYEWTSNSDNGDNLHRNVIFRDGADKTRAIPPLTTFISADPSVKGVDPESLWAWLDKWEAKTGGKALAIPHNGNMSNGRMFELMRYNGQPLTRKWADARARWEVLYEVFQYKGSGEAHPLLSPTDEYANFGIWDTANLNGIVKVPGMINTEYAREALKNGLLLQNQLGANPFKLGLVSGTDTHNAMSTGGQEDDFYGKFAVSEPRPGRWKSVYKQEGDFTRYDWTVLAAGVTGVWATANTREAIWDAMKRREVYASSGPRMTLRFFGGFDFTDGDANSAGELVAAGYSRGVPMGGDLAAPAAGQRPTFLFAAMKDPELANLDSVQIIKGWVDAAGETHEKIFNVAWSETDRRSETDGKLTPVGSTVDLTNATYTNSIGASELMGSFTDPDFDPAERAFYYLRAVEIPTPRWTLYDSVKFGVTMSDDVPMVQQERAVTSPIWYNPGQEKLSRLNAGVPAHQVRPVIPAEAGIPSVLAKSISAIPAQVGIQNG